MKRLLTLLSLCLAVTSVAQYDPLHPPASFQSADNPLYWKNRKPYEGYWQQDVQYHIKATLDDQQERITGTLRLEYTNNSPSTLKELYFHVYQNAFEPGSYKQRLEQSGEADTAVTYQHTEVSNLRVNEVEHAFEKDNTILRVVLANPLASGETVWITCEFITQFGPDHGRMKTYTTHGYKHFNVVHWYPRISVFDRKFGWTTDQHLGNEFYGDFGSFDVEILIPEHYVLEATGNLLNREEVLPASLMEKLDIRKYANKPWNEKPSEVIAPSQKLKTWKFHAENVHDFAWTADPAYRIGTATAKLENGREVTCVALAQEQHASGWQNAAAYTARIIELYSKDFGEYAYHKMVVADARDGMEYPMLTLDGGRDPQYRDLLAHEVGHNWFYGMVGNNETYRAALDEGFTQFMTSWAMTALEGDTLAPYNKGLWWKWFYEPELVRDNEVYNGYYYSAIARDEDPQLNTHSDQFEHRSQYGQVYYKTATMLYNLQYVLGDSLFLSAMQHYFNQWKFCHPYFEDFRASIIQATGVDLNWFFDQWLETDKKINYAISAFAKKGQGKYELRLKRKGGMQMPLDIALYDKNGREYLYHIPNTGFVKNTGAGVLPQWYGWGDFNREYNTVIELDADIRKVRIDPSGRLADVYQLNNTSPMEVSLELDDLLRLRMGHRYEVEWFPSIWYNGYDGVKTGIGVSGSYRYTYHQFDAGFWFSPGIAQQQGLLEDTALSDQFNRFSYRINYSTPLRGIGKSLSLNIGSRWLDGLVSNSIGWSKQLPNDKTSIGFDLKSLYRPRAADLNYLIYPGEWNANRWNNFSEMALLHRYRYGNSEGRITSKLRSPFFWSDYSYGFINLEAVNENRFGGLNLRTRAFGQYGLGNQWAPESQLYASGGNPESMMSDPFVRSIGFIPSDLYGYSGTTGNFQPGGGLNLRGYNNYVLPELNSDSLLRFAYAGYSGLALNTEMEFDDLVQINSRTKGYVELKTYLFADAGMININRSTEPLEWSNIRIDAGVGLALQIYQWGTFHALKPLTIRADFPLFLNRPPSSQEYFAFRWLIGVQRAF